MSASVKIHIDDVRIQEIKELAPPAHVLREFPATPEAAATAFESRAAIHRILHGADDRLLVVIGPCSIHDPEAAIELHRHAEGETVTLPVGGKQDPAYGGGPLILTGTIRRLSDGSYRGDGPMLGGLDRSFGPTAVLHVDGIDILIVTESEQMLDRQQLYAFGIDPTRKAVLALKSMQHFRAAFEPIAARVIVCDSGALATPDVTRRTYTRVRRPIWPLDKMVTFP